MGDAWVNKHVTFCQIKIIILNFILSKIFQNCFKICPQYILLQQITYHIILDKSRCQAVVSIFILIIVLLIIIRLIPSHATGAKQPRIQRDDPEKSAEAQHALFWRGPEQRPVAEALESTVDKFVEVGGIVRGIGVVRERHGRRAVQLVVDLRERKMVRNKGEIAIKLCFLQSFSFFMYIFACMLQVLVTMGMCGVVD